MLPFLPAFVLDAGYRLQLINIVTAMATHASDTYGESRSPDKQISASGAVAWKKTIKPTDSCAFPEKTQESEIVASQPGALRRACQTNSPFLIPVHYTWHRSSHICTCAYQEQKDQEKRLEVEERRLGKGWVQFRTSSLRDSTHHFVFTAESLLDLGVRMFCRS